MPDLSYICLLQMVQIMMVCHTCAVQDAELGGAHAATAAQACSCLSELVLTHTSVSDGSFLTALASSCTRLTLLHRHHTTISAAAEATLGELATSLPELFSIEIMVTPIRPLAYHPQL